MANGPQLTKPASPLRDALRIFVRNKPALMAFIMILVLGTAALSGVIFTGKKPDDQEKVRLEEAQVLGDRVKLEVNPIAVLDPITIKLKNTFLHPTQSSRDPEVNAQYLLGTDHLGRDVLARLWAGSSISLTIGFLAVGISVLLGISLGGIAGFFGRGRVSLPMLATILCALAGAILHAADIGAAGTLLFIIGAGLFAGQALVCLLTRRIKTVVFFVVAVLSFAAVISYNSQIESVTPEGRRAQAAARIHSNARSLMLEIRDLGDRIKDFENTPEGGFTAKEGERRPEPPEWMIKGQAAVEAKARMLELDVMRYDLVNYESGAVIGARLADEQIGRAAYLESRMEAVKARFADADAALKALNKQLETAVERKDDDVARRLRGDLKVQDARRSTFDPEKLAETAEYLRRTGTVEGTRAENLIELMQKPAEEFRAALNQGEDGLKKALDASAVTRAELRMRGYEIEAAMRNVRTAKAKFNVADAQARADAALAAQRAAETYSEKLPAGRFKEDAEKLAKSLQAEVERLRGAVAAKNTELEEKQAAGSKWSEHVENARKVISAPAGPERDAALKALDLAGPVLDVQGSFALLERRGGFRKAYVLKYDAEAKNRMADILNAELLGGHHRYGLYRMLRHFLTYIILGLLLLVSGLSVLAAAQGGVADSLRGLKKVFLPTITVDDLVMRFTEVMMTIPVIFLILAVLALFEKDVFITMAVIGLTSWMGTTRFVRAEILSLREQDFIQAARSLGVSDFRIIWRHLVPNAISPVLVSATLGVAGAVLAESTLSFLGIGAGPTQSTWGKILSEGREYINDAPWLSWIPGIAILITVLSFNLLGEGLREAFNPKLRGR